VEKALDRDRDQSWPRLSDPLVGLAHAQFSGPVRGAVGYTSVTGGDADMGAPVCLCRAYQRPGSLTEG
jgi:hypothetical protein